MAKRLEKYIELREILNPGKKTKKWEFYRKDGGETVAKIYWYGGWRKYVAELYQNGFYDWDFLREVADFCEKQTKDHFSL